MGGDVIIRRFAQCPHPADAIARPRSSAKAGEGRFCKLLRRCVQCFSGGMFLTLLLIAYGYSAAAAVNGCFHAGEAFDVIVEFPYAAREEVAAG